MLPDGNETVEMTTGGELTWIDNCLEAELLAASVARTVKLASPGTLGVPEMLPAELRLRPTGKAPALMLKVIAPDPPAEPTDAL